MLFKHRAAKETLCRIFYIWLRDGYPWPPTGLSKVVMVHAIGKAVLLIRCWFSSKD